jgi:hypothetical protein
LRPVYLELTVAARDHRRGSDLLRIVVTFDELAPVFHRRRNALENSLLLVCLELKGTFARVAFAAGIEREYAVLVSVSSDVHERPSVQELFTGRRRSELKGALRHHQGVVGIAQIAPVRHDRRDDLNSEDP